VSTEPGAGHLNGEAGKWLLGLCGGSSIVVTIKSLWTLPAPTSLIITIRNKLASSRFYTKVLGCITLTFLVIAVVMYVICYLSLGPTKQVCELVTAPSGAARILLPFFGMSVVSLALFAWFQARVLNLKEK
jgi:hypothetical protein